MIRHTSAVVECDVCGIRSVPASTAKEARVYARAGGFVRRNWNRRMKDLCAMCPGKAPVHDTTTERNPA